MKPFNSALRIKKSRSGRAADVRQAQDALLYSLAKMAEARDGETAGHLRRLQRYCAALANRLRHDRGALFQAAPLQLRGGFRSGRRRVRRAHPTLWPSGSRVVARPDESDAAGQQSRVSAARAQGVDLGRKRPVR